MGAGIHDIEIDYEQRPETIASLQVRWTGPGFAEEVIPVYGFPDDINPGECPINPGDAQNYEGGPVNTKNGNYLYQVQDLQIPTLAGPLAFKRTYSAQAVDTFEDELLGYGWTHNHDRRLIFPLDNGGEDGTVILRGKSGSALRFRIIAGEGENEYEARPEVKADMVEIPDEGGNTFVITAPNQSVMTFSDYGLGVGVLLDTYQDTGGNVLTYTYSSGQLSRVEDANGRHLEFSIGIPPGGGEGALDRLLSVSDHSGRLVQFGYYTDTGDLAMVTDTQGFTWTYTYSGATHWLYEARDPYKRVIERNDYDEYGRVITQTDGLSQTISFEYHIDTTSRTTVTYPLGRVLVDVYDSRNTLVGQVRPGESITTGRGYDGHFNRRSTTDANDNTTRYGWSENGYNLGGITDAQGLTTSFDYDAYNHLTQVTDAQGNATSYEYDEYNNLTAITNALDGVTINRYDSRGNLTQTVRNGLYTMTYEYDEFGQRVAVTDTLGHSTRYEYDGVGRTLAVTTPQGITRYAYDEADHMVAITRNYSTTTPNPDPTIYNLSTRYSFDALGHQTHVTETVPLPDGGVEERVTRTWYDPIGRVFSVTQNYRPGNPQNYLNQYNLTTRYGYDAASNQVAVTDTLGHVNRTFYDTLNRPITTVMNYQDSVYDPDEPDEDILTTYNYDAVGNLITTTDTLGRMTVNGYDELNRLVTSTVN